MVKTNQVAALVLLAVWQMSCSPTNFSASDEDSSAGAAQQICDPFDTGAGGSATKGLVSSLHYVTGSSDGIESFADLLSRSKQSQYALILPDVNVPDRDFDQGFAFNSKAVEDDAGQKLIEWFGLRMRTELSLPPGHETGLYQFQIFSDDGSIVYYNEGAGMQTLINHDGNHSPSAKCSDTTIALTSSSRLPFYIDYFQGPRTRIALQLMWRKAEPAQSCEGASDWQVVPAAAFHLPDGIINKCL